MEIKLSNELKQMIKNQYVPAEEIVKYIMDEGFGTTEKAIEETSLGDINFNGKFAKNAWFNTKDGKLVLEF